ncbi:MAG: NUDIX domain-containing protein [Candidatus Saccharibacteria bacterium]|nr:NUDIX domain-containing protein [Candidatus Saccharibacteria bacterium]
MNYTGPSSKPHDSGVAVSVIVVNKGKILLLKRQGGSTGVGTWSIPGGAVEFMEDPLQAVARELEEETGLRAKEFELLGYTNDTHPKEKLHYVTFTFFTDKFKGEPKIAEPHKCSEIGWFDFDKLPSPLYTPTANKLMKLEVQERLKII